MNRRLKPYSKRFRASRSGPRAGLTLMEVVAGLALLGWLLSAVVLAKARYTRQWATANQTLLATRAADQLLTHWWSDDQQIPVPASGQIAQPPGLEWRTMPLPSETVEPLGVRLVRLEVVAKNAAPGTPPLVAVDLMLPKLDAANQDRVTNTENRS